MYHSVFKYDEYFKQRKKAKLNLKKLKHSNVTQKLSICECCQGVGGGVLLQPHFRGLHVGRNKAWSLIADRWEKTEMEREVCVFCSFCPSLSTHSVHLAAQVQKLGFCKPRGRPEHCCWDPVDGGGAMAHNSYLLFQLFLQTKKKTLF